MIYDEDGKVLMLSKGWTYLFGLFHHGHSYSGRLGKSRLRVTEWSGGT
jgi:hypothetical protein